MPSHCFCEAVGVGVIRQPANTISSLAFVAVALIVLIRSRVETGSERAQHLARHLAPHLARRFAIAVAVVGAGSAFFHASLTFWGQTADVLGMYLVATFLLLASIVRRVPLSARAQRDWYLGGNLALVALLVWQPALRRYAFAALIVAVLWSEFRNYTRGIRVMSTAPLITAVSLLAFGFAIWTLDLTHRLCNPASVWQGHALWHVCGAASAWFAYRYFTQPTIADRR